MIIDNTINDFRRELLNLGYCKSAVANYPKYAQNILNYAKENPQKITDVHIKNYHEYLKTKPKKNKTGIISPSYIYSQLLAVKLYFDYLERTKTIKQNPYTLRIKQATKNERIVFTQEEIQLLYKNTQNLEEKTILHLCYGCGLRRSEAQDLNIKDVNFEQKLLFVRKGKGKKRRVIPLTESIVQDLKGYYSYTEIVRNENEESFLVNINGSKMKGENVYELFKRILKRTQSLKPENYCLHSLRHSIATHLLENEMSIEMVRDFLGHSQLVSTQIYTRINFLKTKLQQ
jgi:integrase/recombinase XerD